MGRMPSSSQGAGILEARASSRSSGWGGFFSRFGIAGQVGQKEYQRVGMPLLVDSGPTQMFFALLHRGDAACGSGTRAVDAVVRRTACARVNLGVFIVAPYYILTF
jgi:hypothetical protein